EKAPELRALGELSLASTAAGECLLAAGRFGEADRTLRQTLAMLQENRERITGSAMEEHYEFNLLPTQTHLALVLPDTGQPKQAEELYRQALRRTTKTCKTGRYGFYDLELAKLLRHHGDLLYREGRRDEASTSYRQARATLEALVKGNPGYVPFDTELIWL